MSVIFFLALVSGGAFGFAALSIWKLIPIFAVFCATIVVFGLRLNLDHVQIEVSLFASSIAFQVAYMAGMLFSDEKSLAIGSKYGRVTARPELLRAMQRAIAAELPDYFTPLEAAPAQLRGHMAYLRSR